MAYIGVVAESLELLLGEGTSETVEGVLVNAVGLGAEDAHGVVGGSADNTVLELDDVLASNDAVSLGSEERSRLSALSNGGRGSQDGWDQSEKSRQMHDCNF